MIGTGSRLRISPIIAISWGAFAASILTVMLAGSELWAQENSPAGLWKTIDDESGEPKSFVRIWIDHGELFGRIEKLVRKPGQNPEPKCDKCDGDKKDQPMLGMVIISGLRQEGGYWTGGHILDPNNGKVYKCQIKVDDGGQKLNVRGYIGFSLLGRTQTWMRSE